MAKKRKDGYYEVTFTYNGKRYSVYDKSKKEAEKKHTTNKQNSKTDSQRFLTQL